MAKISIQVIQMKSLEAANKECLACNHVGGIYADIPDGCDCNCHDVSNYDK